MAGCSSYTMKGIASACKDSLGGVKSIYVAKRDELSSIPAAVDGVITPLETDIPNFWKYNVRKATSSATSTLQVSESAGNSWQTELSLQFMKQDVAKRAEVQALSEEGVVVIFVDGNGKAWFMGYDYPVEASAATAETGTALTDLNGYNLTLTDNSIELPFSVDSAFMSKLVAAKG